MNKELKNSTIVVVITASLAAFGFLGKDYFEGRNDQQKYINDLYKQLYEESGSELENLNSAYSELEALLAKNYALTTFELDPIYLNLRSAVDSYEEYIRKLERYGNSEQIKVSKSLFQWVLALYSQFDLHYKSVELVQRRVHELLLIESPKSDLFEFVSKALEAELENLIHSENRIYYDSISYHRPVIRGFEQYLNYQFRTTIGLDPTEEMVKSINDIPRLIDRNKGSIYINKKFPYLFAEVRSFLAASFEFTVENDFQIQKNRILSNNVKAKFITSVLKNDSYLRDSFTKRKSRG